MPAPFLKVVKGGMSETPLLDLIDRSTADFERLARQLKNERIRQGLTLEEISLMTGYELSKLQAVEEEATHASLFALCVYSAALGGELHVVDAPDPLNLPDELVDLLFEKFFRDIG